MPTQARSTWGGLLGPPHHATRLQRPGVHPFGLAAVATAAALYALLVRPHVLTWGATREEASSTYPGDDLIPEPNGGGTMATTLPAPPERVWPWLVQMGGGRGGWYSWWDWLDNRQVPSADRILAEWQNLDVGQRVMGPTNWWTVVVLEPSRTLVLRSIYSMSGRSFGRSFNPRTGPMPRMYVDGIWGFHLRPSPVGQTRLVVRTRSSSHPSCFALPFGFLVGEPVHFSMQTRQFHNLRKRVAQLSQ